MALDCDLRVLYHLVLKPVRGADHAARMESFYAGQAEAYDGFRSRLLQGRRELYGSIGIPDDGVWVDLGGGTGSNQELLGPRIAAARKVYIVDLSASLLKVADQRIARHGWSNVRTVQADATTFQPADGPADVVTFSYALTMIPDWFAAIENAFSILKPGGLVGVVDFHVARKHPADGMAAQSWFTRSFWPVWFAADNVFLSADHVPFLRRRFEPVSYTERRARIPYLPLLRVPYYTFVGRKPRTPLAPREG
jgi:S-adenosylmethionine-diacylgycerolhomoserine-N-methlytransferase